MVQLLARGFARLDRAVDDLHALGHLELRRVAFEVVAAGRRDSERGCEDSGPWDRAFLDRLPDADVTVARAFRLDVADRRESLFQRLARRSSRARRAQRKPGIEDIRVVASLRRVLAPQEHVSVRVD